MSKEDEGPIHPPSSVHVTFLLGAGRQSSQGSASVFCYYLCFLCSKFPARLQNLNLVKGLNKSTRKKFRRFEAGRRYKVAPSFVVTVLESRLRLIKFICLR